MHHKFLIQSGNAIFKEENLFLKKIFFGGSNNNAKLLKAFLKQVKYISF